MPRTNSDSITVKHPAAALFVARKLGLPLVASAEGYKFRTNLTIAQALNGYASSRIKHDHDLIKALASDLRLAKKSQ